MDAVNNLVYIAESDNNLVRIVNRTTNSLATIVGNGWRGYYGDGNKALNASLNNLHSVTIDEQNNLLYIADTDNHRIRVVNRQTNIITTFAGNGKATYNGDNIDALSASLNSPTEVAIDSHNNLVYIADTMNHRIRFVNRTNNLITTVAGTGIAGFFGDGSEPKSALLDSPRSVAVDSHKNLVYIADTKNHRIRVVNLSSNIILTFAGNGSRNYAGDGGIATDAALSDPTEVDIDVLNNVVYLADTGNKRVRVVNRTSNIITTFVGNGGQSYAGDGKTSTNASLNYVTGLAVDTINNLMYVADSPRIRLVTGISCNIGTAGPNCAYCSAGFYADVISSLECKPCMSGSYSPSIGAHSSSTCIPCNAGTFSNSTGSHSNSTCIPCAEGSFAPEGASICNLCKPYSFSRSGFKECLPCENGLFFKNSLWKYRYDQHRRKCKLLSFEKWIFFDNH